MTQDENNQFNMHTSVSGSIQQSFKNINQNVETNTSSSTVYQESQNDFNALKPSQHSADDDLDVTPTHKELEDANTEIETTDDSYSTGRTATFDSNQVD